ncbi:tripartite tricarboxylate transporter substrate-binding protein [Nonomuraea sp. NPDC048916]|uniref:tripartite tricarboxylate transporter substrate-binding protein n=1 Tax=Nonomuraea sp. NPDC048916 TaxID=3154232 RepID=UPI0033D8EBD0
MRRRHFFALGLGVVACAGGCGAERGVTAGPRARFSVVPGGERWENVVQALVRAGVRAGFEVSGRQSEPGPATPITVTGLPALAAAELNGRPTLIDTTTPLARLVGDIEVVVVPANSRFRDFDEFGAHLLADPEQTLLAGGPQGEPDHLLFGLIARGLGADTRRVDYTGYPSAVGAATALLGGRAAAAAGTLGDWRGSIRMGLVRVLAVSCAHRVDGVDAPSLLESGVRVDFADWCAAVGPSGMSEESRASAIEMCEAVADSATWRAACRARGWSSIPLTGDDFEVWLASEIDRTRAVLRDLGLLNTPGTTCWGSCGNGH